MSLDIWLTISVDTGGGEPYTATLYDGNITHNVGAMWSKAGVWDALYESAGKTAGDILPALLAGAIDMRANLAEYRKLNPPNGWGSADDALTWLDQLTTACGLHPKAVIGVSR